MGEGYYAREAFNLMGGREIIRSVAELVSVTDSINER
jgi:hypothetical protein